MKRITAIVLILLLGIFISRCQFDYESPENMIKRLDRIAGEIGNSQITDDRFLIGTRNNSEDEYTGEYKSLCSKQNGRDVIFGGGSVKERSIHICGHISSESGEAAVRIRMNSAVTELETDENGYFETVLSITGGGCYIMADYKNFSGSVELVSEYSPESFREI